MSEPQPTDEQKRAAIIARFMADRRLAHSVIFRGRHEAATPVFHGEIIDDWHGPHPRVLTMAFRHGAKTTLAEEAIILRGSLAEYHYCLIVGSTKPQALKRLEAIKHEFETNDYLAELFGDQRGDAWAEDRIILKNGACIQAIGRGQSMRGIKYLQWRPELIFLDDIEEDEESRDETVREKSITWVLATLLPAAARTANTRIRVAETPRDPDGLPMRLKRNPGWQTKVYPVETVDDDGRRLPLWPELYPLEEIDRIKADMAREGKLAEFEREYMCQADRPVEKSFKPESIRVEIYRRTWEPVYCMIDPARTVKDTSAHTGVCAWSWIGRRLRIWRAYGAFLRPDEIIDAIFRLDEEFSPVLIGVEETGLNEFIMQPLRHAMEKRQRIIPVRAVNAPRNKIDFILGLQPFHRAGEIIWNEEFPDLRMQLLSFPKGRIDVPNALAYALRLRPGQPVYEDFDGKHVVEGLKADPRRVSWLALGSTGALTTAVLAQFIEGGLRVTADWLQEGDAGTALHRIVQEAQAEAGRRDLRLVAGPQHFEQWNNVGLAQAARKAASDVRVGVQPILGRQEIVRLMRTSLRQMPALQIAAGARWTLNAMAGGFCRAADRRGVVQDMPEPGAYTVLMEGLESFAGMMAASTGEEDRSINYALAKDGTRYVSALRRPR
ncbi:MAG: hypothetical protein AABZ67_00655 [Pseudomonadota bacterium]